MNEFSIPTPNFDGTVSPYVITGTTNDPGHLSLTELARSFQHSVPSTPLTDIFPEEEIAARDVYIQQKMSTTDTIFPIARFGQPDVVLGHNYETMRAMRVQPLYIRRSAFLSYGEMNVRIRPGTANDSWSQEEQISEVIEGMVREHNLTWDVWRAQMLLGGIDYTDPRSGFGASVNSQIPARNFFSYDVVNGYRGRPEANLFRTMSDYNNPDTNTKGVPWTHPEADIVNCIVRLSRWFKETNKGVLRKMYVHPELKEVIFMNNQVRLITGGLLGSVNNERINPGSDIVATDQAGLGGYNIGISGDEIISIAGVEIVTVNTTYKDPVDGANRRVFPKNKVVFVADRTTNGESIQVGRTQYCVSEESGGQPGLWTRQQRETPIPAAPGMYIQMGNAGMPYLRYPYMVVHMKVAEVEEINTRIGILGDLHFGTM